ncbi:phosphopantetheine-binding protein [Actinomadura rudentiformis]|uniref:Phosphopantetheine-binding protein n=1 Tax=Actinomadura rudentiformis TaxID=359158 RepID=A0A6H9YTZ1_9ACTN|nr:phosphopantetheine-binding protein [Actinomadura rudentiformis]KAB2346964.1 phosphopantetheine-binding protein [Actinomadura rudentiformis]
MITRDSVQEAVAERLDSPPAQIPGDTNLVQLGLTSLDLMALVNGWRRQGLPVVFRELVREPTVDGWWRYLEGLQDEHAEVSP